MVDPVSTRIWSYRLLYLALSGLLIFLYLLPLQIAPPQWAAPDLLVCLALAWVIRRPEYVPALSIAAVFLMADLFFHRPPGLFAALCVLGGEYLRARAPFMRDFSFVMEWLFVSAVIFAIMLAYRVVLIVTVVEPPTLWLAALQFAATVLSYPLVVGLTRFGLGLRRATVRTNDRRGQRA